MKKSRPNKFKPNDFHRIYKQNIHKLTNAFPGLFNKDFPKPLACGIHEKLINYVDLTEDELHKVLAIWTTRSEYRATLCCVGLRYDLKGQPVGEINAWERNNAIKGIHQIKKKAVIETVFNILQQCMTEAAYETWEANPITKKKMYAI